jgi:hypothetical protein
MNHAIKAIAHETKIRRVAYFYSAAERRSRGALWPSFAPALILEFVKSLAWSDGVARSLSSNKIPVNKEVCGMFESLSDRAGHSDGTSSGRNEIGMNESPIPFSPTAWR